MSFYFCPLFFHLDYISLVNPLNQGILLHFPLSFCIHGHSSLLSPLPSNWWIGDNHHTLNLILYNNKEVYFYTFCCKLNYVHDNCKMLGNGKYLAFADISHGNVGISICIPVHRILSQGTTMNEQISLFFTLEGHTCESTT